MKCLTHRGGITVLQTGALNEQDVDGFLHWIDPALSAMGAAVAIVNITPTPKDNQALGKYSRIAVKLYRAIEILAGVVTPLVKR